MNLAGNEKDDLSLTYEDPAVITPEERTKHFGQRDHLRIFGDDLPAIIESKGFSVTTVDTSMFSKGMQEEDVLFPPTLSKHPLCTNHRKVFFCQKVPKSNSISG